jgi:hypothetical protein
VKTKSKDFIKKNFEKMYFKEKENGFRING